MGNELDTIDVERELRLLIQQQAPSTWQIEDLHAALSIGEGGVGLDSVAMVELFVVCEEHFGLPFPVKMLDDTPPTVGQLIDHVRHLRSGEAPMAT
jgi:acyl carrier protein